VVYNIIKRLSNRESDADFESSESYHVTCDSDLEINFYQLYCYIDFNLVSSKAVSIFLIESINFLLI
jgi:hypothetical protein